MMNGNADDASRRLDQDTDILFDQAACALLSTLPNGEIITVNQTFLDWIGSSREAILGKRFQSLLMMGSKIYFETHYAPLLQMQGAVREIALEMRRQDGTVCPVVASARQVRSADGAAIVNRVALFDSTDRRRYEKELLQARKLAEEAASALASADERKNEFIAMLAHELRNPLAPIRNIVELQRRGGDIDRGKTHAVLGRQVAQMVRLVDDLIDVSRIAQEKLTLRRVPVDLGSVVQHAVEASEPLFEHAGVRFNAAFPPAPVYVEADAARLAQVVGNVLNNAAKFTPEGGSVTLTLIQEEGRASVSVRDSGIGIDPERLPEVFRMFMQAAPTAGRQGGLGIGLTLAKSLIERHEGRITVHSEGPGTGTEFIIQLPALLEAPRTVSHTYGPPQRPASPPQRRILVVDDNHDSADLMTMLLTFEGHDVRQAHEGLEAVALAEEFRPEVVLLDIGLPTLSGYQVAERIRQFEGMKPVLVALTGWGQEEDRRRSKAAGFDAHLVKPIDHEALLRLINELPSG